MDRSTLLGMTTGAVFMFGFGIVWLLIGLLRGRSLPVWVSASLLFIGIALGTCIASLGHRASKMPLNLSPLSAQQLAANRRIEQHFYVIFAIELAAIFLAVILLKAVHYPDYILCGIALIVGVHFFPLAALFKVPLYYGTALCGCAIGLFGFLVTDSAFRQKVVALSFGFLLWATAAWIVFLGLTAMPQNIGNLRPM
jgi:hypothetical protein